MHKFSEYLSYRRELIKVKAHPLRKIFNKQYSYRLVQKCRIPVPKKYFSGDDSQFFIPGDLPRAYVLKTTSGHSGVGVICCVDGVDLMTNQAIDIESFAQILSTRKVGYLIEEFIPNRDGKYDVVESFKVFYFGKAGLIIRYVREFFNVKENCISAIEQSFYDQNWNYIENEISSYVKQGPPIEKPMHFDLLVEYAHKAGELIGDFVRVDFFMSPEGPIFNEYSPFPFNGKHFTPYGEQLLGGLWMKGFPEKITCIERASSNDSDEIAELLTEYYFGTYTGILDEEALRTVNESALRSKVDKLIQLDESRLFVARDQIDKKIVGISAVGPLRWKHKVPPEYTHEYFWFYVRPEYRGFGIGNLLLKAREKFVIGQGFNKACGFVLEKNRYIINYYKNRGSKVLASKSSTSSPWNGENIIILGFNLKES